VILMVLLGGMLTGMAPNASASFTVATFEDPADNDSTPLFTVDLSQTQGKITGGWLDSQTGLDLVVGGYTFTDAFFTMTDVDYDGDLSGGTTGDGTIKFFADGDTTGNPLVQIVFDSATVTPLGFGGMNAFFFDNGVVITGSEIPGSLTDESFSFSFANQAPLNGNSDNGYTATAAFTSSAVPEPATLGLLLVGGMGVLLKRRRK